MQEEHNNYVWVFHGMNGRFTSGVFRSKELAIQWIERENLQGVLTKYPLDTGVYDWAISEGLFTPKDAKHKTPEFKQKFTSASQEHVHFEND